MRQTKGDRGSLKTLFLCKQAHAAHYARCFELRFRLFGLFYRRLNDRLFLPMELLGFSEFCCE